MPAFLSLALLVLGQAPAAPDSLPLLLHRNMELDDQDRAIRRQHDLVLTRKAQQRSRQKLVERGLVSREESLREQTDIRLQEAREAEMIAYRTFKAYERDLLGGGEVPNEAHALSLLLDLLGKQEAMARVELDYRAYRVRQEQALFERNATSRFQRDLAALDHEAAKGNVEISVARQAQVAMELAARTAGRPYDAEEFLRRKAEYLQARIRYSEVRVAGVRKRLELATQAFQAGLGGEAEVQSLRAMLNDALEDLAAERKLMKDLETPLPPRSTRFI